MHCEAVDHGTPNLHKDVFYFKYTQEFLPVSNFWQLHALPLPSTIKMKSSRLLDIHKYVYMPLPFSVPLSISLPLFSPLPHSPYSPLPPPITLSFLLPISSPPPIPSLSSALIFPLLTNILSAHFGSFQLSANGESLLYIAEKEKPKATSYFKKGSLSW